MTSKTIIFTRGDGKIERFSDFPPREDMQNWIYLYQPTLLSALSIHLGSAENIIVASEVPLGPNVNIRGDYRIPDLIVCFDCDIEGVRELGGYAIDRQGKAPDFVLEVASRTTGVQDYTTKRRDYKRYGVGEYWRFDPSGGGYHEAALAGDLLVDGQYQPIEIEQTGDGVWRGYSDALGLCVCWEDEMLRFYDPKTEDYLRSHEAERERAEAAEARVAELEAELRRLRGH